jgi:hypothetical protein
MSKEVDYKKQKKQAAKAKKEKLKKKEELIIEEEELKSSKSDYDKKEYNRRKFLTDIISKDLSKDRFDRLYNKFYDTYEDDEDMALFMILINLAYDYDQDNFIKLIENILKNIKSKESGAIIKNKKSKGELTNFYDTSSILELLRLVEQNQKLLDKYNKKTKMIEKYGTIKEAERKELRLLEKMFDDSVRLSNLWKKKVTEHLGKKKRKIIKEEYYDEKELENELENEHKRYLLLLNLSELLKDLEEEKDYEIAYQKLEDLRISFFKEVDEELNEKSPNNDLFKELLRILKFNNLYETRNDLKKILEIYEENNNSILSLLELINNDVKLKTRYSAVRKAIKDVNNMTLENKYGPFSDFLLKKQIEFLNIDRGIKYIEIEEDKDEKGDKDVKYDIKDNKDDIKDIGDDLEELVGQVREAHEEYKDLEFYPLKAKEKEPQKFKKEYKDEIKEEIVKHSLDTLLSTLSKEQLLRVRNVSVFLLNKFFDKDSSIDIENQIYNETKNLELRQYLSRIGKIVILVDSDGLKHIAKLLNIRLSSQYYDVYDLLHLSYKELLEDIYENPLNKNFDKIEYMIQYELNRFFSKFIGYLDFVEFDIEKRDSDYDLFGPNLDDIHILEDIDQCNIEYKNKKVFENYMRLKSEYEKIDIDNPKLKLEALSKLKKEQNNIRKYLKNIVYYKESNKVYCFNFWEIEENFEKGNYTNIYTGNNLSDDFVRKFKILLESRQRRQKNKPIIKEDSGDKYDLLDQEAFENAMKISSERNFFQNIFADINSLELQLKNKISKDEVCEYYQNYVFKDSKLEKLLNKKDIMNDMKKFCGVSVIPEVKENIENISSPSKSHISIPSKISSSPSKSHISIPSIILGEPSQQKSQVIKPKISIPLKENKKIITDDSYSSESESDKEESDESEESEDDISDKEESDESESESDKKENDDSKKVSIINKEDKKKKLMNLLSQLGPDL